MTQPRPPTDQTVGAWCPRCKAIHIADMPVRRRRATADGIKRWHECPGCHAPLISRQLIERVYRPETSAIVRGKKSGAARRAKKLSSISGTNTSRGAIKAA